MPKLTINLCALGDPKSGSTWSGTPHNIYQILAQQGQCATAFNADVPHRTKQILSLLTIPFYGRADYVRAPWRRYACSWQAAQMTAKSPSPHTLHMGTLSLPFWKVPSGQHHYLFCDSTWDLWSRHATNMAGYSPRFSRTIDGLACRAYSQVRHIFSISHYVKENLVQHYGVPAEKVTVVGTGLGVIRPFHGQKQHTNRKILFTAKGRFKDKGGELVLAAFQNAQAIDPQLELTIVGSKDGQQFDHFSNVTTYGFVSLELLQELFETHSLFVMPAYNEPWGLVYLEAMACKMPIMGLNRNSMPELTGNGEFGFCLADNSPEAVGREMVAAFAENGRLQKMGEKAQAYCLENFSWEKTVNTILDVIERLETDE